MAKSKSDNPLVQKVNDLYDEFVNDVDGSFHNDLWQIIVNDSLKREENPDKVFVFSILPGSRGQVVIIEKNVSGYIPCNFVFKEGTRMLSKKGENVQGYVIRALNKRVFGIEADQIFEIEASSYRKPMEKARPTHDKVDGHPIAYRDDPFMNGSYFHKWHNREITNLGGFDTGLFELFYKADSKNRRRLIDAFPDYFLPK